MASHDPIAYTYDADTHCPACAEDRYDRGPGGWIAEDCEDSEGNPVGVIAPWDDEPDGLYCGTCHGTILEPGEDPEPEDACPCYPDPCECAPGYGCRVDEPGTYRHQSVAYVAPSPFARSHASWCRAGEPCHPDRRDDWWAAR